MAPQGYILVIQSETGTGTGTGTGSSINTITFTFPTTTTTPTTTFTFPTVSIPTAAAPVIITQSPVASTGGFSSDAAAFLAIAGALSLGFFALSGFSSRPNPSFGPPPFLRNQIENEDFIINRKGYQHEYDYYDKFRERRDGQSDFESWKDYDNVYFSEIPHPIDVGYDKFYDRELSKARPKFFWNSVFDIMTLKNLANFVPRGIKSLLGRENSNDWKNRNLERSNDKSTNYHPKKRSRILRHVSNNNETNSAHDLEAADESQLMRVRIKFIGAIRLLNTVR